jgi:hypothetical protein
MQFFWNLPPPSNVDYAKSPSHGLKLRREIPRLRRTSRLLRRWVPSHGLWGQCLCSKRIMPETLGRTVYFQIFLRFSKYPPAKPEALRLLAP